MRKVLYVILFSALGALVGAIVAWSTEFAFLTMLDYQSIDGISADLGYAFGKQDAFNYIYLALVASGVVVGTIQGLKTWEQVYGDRIIPLRRQNKIVRAFLYLSLAVGILIFALVTNVFGFVEISQKLKKESDRSLSSLLSQTSTVYGVVFFEEPCKEEHEDEGASECVPRPYQTEFALFKEGRVEKVVESNENGSFEVTVPPGTYEAGMVPGVSGDVGLQKIVISTKAGERTKVEVRYSQIGKN